MCECVCVCVCVCVCSRSRPSCAQIRHVQDREARQSSRMGQAAAEGPRCPLSWGDCARSHAILSVYVERALSLFSLVCVCISLSVFVSLSVCLSLSFLFSLSLSLSLPPSVFACVISPSLSPSLSLSFAFSLALSLSPLPAAACHVLIICELHTTGKAEVDWVEDYISVSSYPLSGAVAAGKFCNAFEDLWSIL